MGDSKQGRKGHFHSISTKDWTWNISRPELSSFNVIRLTEMQMWDVVNLMTVVTSVFCNHIPHELERLAVTHAICTPPPWICFHGCQALVAASTPNAPPLLPCCHLVPSSLCLRSNFQLVINKKREEASWMGISGMTPGWAKSEEVGLLHHDSIQLSNFHRWCVSEHSGLPNDTKRITWGL